MVPGWECTVLKVKSVFKKTLFSLSDQGCKPSSSTTLFLLCNFFSPKNTVWSAISQRPYHAICYHTNRHQAFPIFWGNCWVKAFPCSDVPPSQLPEEPRWPRDTYGYPRQVALLPGPINAWRAEHTGPELGASLERTECHHQIVRTSAHDRKITYIVWIIYILKVMKAWPFYVTVLPTCFHLYKIEFSSSGKSFLCSQGNQILSPQNFPVPMPPAWMNFAFFVTDKSL